jgi:hypothetical protein
MTLFCLFNIVQSTSVTEFIETKSEHSKNKQSATFQDCFQALVNVIKYQESDSCFNTQISNPAVNNNDCKEGSNTEDDINKFIEHDSTAFCESIITHTRRGLFL